MCTKEYSVELDRTLEQLTEHYYIRTHHRAVHTPCQIIDSRALMEEETLMTGEAHFSGSYEQAVGVVLDILRYSGEPVDETLIQSICDKTGVLR